MEDKNIKDIIEKSAFMIANNNSQKAIEFLKEKKTAENINCYIILFELIKEYYQNKFTDPINKTPIDQELKNIDRKLTR